MNKWKSISIDDVSGCGVVRPLSRHGCYCKACTAGTPCELKREQIDVCKEWFSAHEFKVYSRAYANDGTSYSWKHAVESWSEMAKGTRHYISNGAFIAAALECGWVAYVLAVGGGINAVFNFRRIRIRLVTDSKEGAGPA
jgi:hypothetical protein